MTEEQLRMYRMAGRMAAREEWDAGVRLEGEELEQHVGGIALEVCWGLDARLGRRVLSSEVEEGHKEFKKALVEARKELRGRAA